MAQNTPRFDVPLIAVNQAQKEVTHNEAVTVFDILSHLVVQSRGLSQPPVSPVVGMAWIVGAAAMNEWQGQDGNIAFWSAGGWRFIPADEGVKAWVIDEQISAQYMQDVWTKIQAVAQPMISSPSGGAVIDVEARSAISNIISALETHGLIATI